tara:strand:- start:84 stop:983 length:900 start_codon:yes stop_codon:yes gene_type:complete
MISKKRILIFFSACILLIFIVYLALSLYITTLAIKATRKLPDSNPASVNLNFQNVDFYSEDGIRLNGWFVPNKNLDTVIIIHGVDANKSDGYILDLMKDTYDMGYSVFTFDLRAHGDSGGKNLGLAYEEKKDLKASILFLKQEFDVQNIVLYGISYGGTIVISNSNLDESIQGIVVDSPFYDLPELLASEVSSRTFIPEFLAKLLKFGIIRSVDFLYGIKTDDIISGIDSVNEFNSPVLLYHCKDDERIPISHSNRINKFLPPNSEYIIYDNCDHANGYEENTVDFNKHLESYYKNSFY